MTRKLTPLTVALCGMMAAVIFVATYFFRIPLYSGYIHLGDGFILLSAAVLGWPAVLSAAIGSMLADLLAGYSVYMLPTFLIKGGMAAVAVLASARKSQPLQTLYMLIAEAVMVVGYFVTNWLILSLGWLPIQNAADTPLMIASASIMGDVLQGLSGVAIWVILMPVVRRIRKQP
jgi:uncharacterized membrane protein